MRDGPRCFTPDSSCPALLRHRPEPGHRFRLRGSHPPRPPFPRRSATSALRPHTGGPTTPQARRHARGLGSSAFARRYWRNHCCFLLLRVLRCFSSPRWPRLQGRCPLSGRVPPFGNPRITSYLPIPAAFRSLSRPSSPPGATGIPHAPSFAFLLLLSVPRRGLLRPRRFSLSLVLLRVHHVNDLSFSWRITDSNR